MAYHPAGWSEFCLGTTENSERAGGAFPQLHRPSPEDAVSVGMGRTVSARGVRVIPEPSY